MDAIAPVQNQSRELNRAGIVASGGISSTVALPLAQIEALEDAIAASDYPLLQCETRHYFWEENGVKLYGRELTIPAGGLLTGKEHYEAHVNVIPEGEIEVSTSEGMRTIKGPYSFIAPAGTKRVGLARKRTVWLTIHRNPTGSLDPEEMERLLVKPVRTELAAAIQRKLSKTKEILCRLSR